MDWRRLLVESLAVILSILLAFSIDALWDSHRERQREHDLLRSLLDDFLSSRSQLESRLVLAQRMAAGNAQLRDLLDARDTGVAVTIPDSLILAVITGPTYEPATNALDAALASGEIELLSNEDLRTELANWRRTLADTAEDELEVRRITNEQLVPLLARSISLRPYFEDALAWAGGDPFGPGRLIEGGNVAGLRGQTSLRTSTELTGVLALRQFYAEFSAADLEALLASLDRAVTLLQEHVAR